MAANPRVDIDELKAEVSSLKSDISDIADTLRKLSGDVVTDGRERLRQAGRQSREKARETWSAVEHEIEERPLTSLAAAFGIGFVLGKLLDR